MAFPPPPKGVGFRAIDAMKSIRGKLFMSVGAILLLVALLSYFMPRFFVKRDIDSAGNVLSETFVKSAQEVQLAFTTAISGQFIQEVTQLEGLIRLLTQQSALFEEKKTLREKGSLILQFAPTLAYIQIGDKKSTVTLAPENGRLYGAEWAPLGKERLAIRIPNRGLFLAELHPLEREPNEAYYFLYPTPPSFDTSHLTFNTFKDPTPVFSSSENPNELFAYMQWAQSQLIDKAEMIKMLAPRPEAAGMLTVNRSFEEGYILLADEVFLSKPEIDLLPLPKVPYLLLRQVGTTFFLDFVRDFALDGLKIVIGYSLSTVAKEVTAILKKPLLLSETGTEGILFFPDGSQALLPTGSFNLNQITYKNVAYVVEPHKIANLTISLLTPIKEAYKIRTLMTNLESDLINKISLNLLAITFFVFIIALILLARLSKTMTRPIVQLAQASKEIGKGHYDKVLLPKIKRPSDEIAVLINSFEEMLIALRDREKIRGALNKVVSKEVAAEILNSSIELGGEERVVTLLFSDIRNFTRLSNHFTPKDLIGLLNKYMTHMCHIIDDTHGVVDKFVGDEIMALYGAPLALENHADRALEAATQMIHDLKEWNVHQIENGKKPLEIGIGVHTGSVCAGNMGAENRLNYTVIGAHVNLAARMCSAAKPMQVLVSKNTIDALKNPDKFHFEPVPPVMLKGFDEPISLFEVT